MFCKQDLDILRNKKIAIVGGAGFIGHNLALKLHEIGSKPFLIDSLQVNSLGYYTSGYMQNSNSERYIGFINERLELIRNSMIPINITDARDYHLLTKEIENINPDVIIHLAAVSHANRSNKDPYSTFDHSLRTLENVLDIIKNKEIHLIYFSSSMVYGNFEGASVDEEKVCNPLGIYGSLKYAAEKIIIGYHQVFGTKYTIIRPSALYGERCVSRRVGQAFIENALEGKNLTVNGSGDDSLDFTYIDDLVQGILLTITNKKSINEIFNITFGSARKLNELAEIVIKNFDNISLKHNPRDNLMPERGTLDISKAKDLLGYEPMFPIEKGFVKYINWYQEFFKKNPALFNKESILTSCKV